MNWRLRHLPIEIFFAGQLSPVPHQVPSQGLVEWSFESLAKAFIPSQHQRAGLSFSRLRRGACPAFPALVSRGDR